ncbi:hypothetical protein CYY_007452 [Polysphondylium violaceum]|uniref:Voltage-gated hydrogen channel 1 n=1 Tax=Polysphondylium violaceum TaxID=133409 RepID=A0A8J4UXQ5_9MYCE|nr:hypothetical protein CYY_007452 [Polysphondylium violaceum]
MNNDENIDIPSPSSSSSPIPNSDAASSGGWLRSANIREHDNDSDTGSDISGYTKPKRKRPLFYPFHLNIHLPSAHDRAKWRYKLGAFIESHRVQYFIVALIILDLIITIVEMFLEETYKCKEHHEIPHAVERAEDVFKIVTLVLLGIFELEIVLLIIAFGVDFFKHPLYVLDGIIITTSIVIDVVFRDAASNLLIIFRLWRIVRVAHGVMVSVESHDKEKYKHLKHHFKQSKIRWKETEMENMELKRRLGIPLDEKIEYTIPPQLTSDSMLTNPSYSSPTFSPSTYTSMDSPISANNSRKKRHTETNSDDDDDNDGIAVRKEKGSSSSPFK